MSTRAFRPRFRQRDAAGFTLIEVLVVVAILALLITILLPSLKRARDQAKISACLANLHDLGVAHHTYANENRATWFVPTPYIGSTVYQGDPGGDDNLFTLWNKKYARNPLSFTCPATTHRLRTPDRVETYLHPSGMIWYRLYTRGVERNDFEYLAQKRSSGGYGTSYEYNLWVGDNRTNTQTKITWHPHWANRNPISMYMKTAKMRLPRPEFSILMHDGDDGADDGNIVGSTRIAFNNYPEPWDNHGSMGMNILYADAHTEFVRTWDLAPPGSGGRIWRRQNR